MDEKTIAPETDSGAGSQPDERRSRGVALHGHTQVHGDVVGSDKVLGDKVTGDKIEAQVGDVGPGAQVAIGKQIQQMITQAPTELTAAERAEIARLLAELKSQLASLDIPESKKLVGQEFVGQLEKELTSTDKPPDASTIKVAGNWLLDNIPALAGTVVSVFASPIVGKVVEAAGDIAAEWVSKRLASQT